MNQLTVGENEKTCVFFEINNSKYMIDAKNVIEIIKLPYIEYNQKLPKNVCGLLEYRSSMINIVDLRNILNLEILPYSTDDQVLILNLENLFAGVVVNKVNDIKKIDQKFLKKTPWEHNEGVVQSIYSAKNVENIMFIDIKSLSNILRTSFDDFEFSSPMNNLLPQDENSKRVLMQRSLELKNKEDIANYAVSNSLNQYITFKIDDITYCMQNTYVKSFYKLSDSKITKVPCTPDFIAGLLNVKGFCVCVIDLKNYLNRGKTKECEKSTIIILEAGEFQLGILTDEIGQNLNVEPNVLEDSKSNKEKAEIIDYVKDNKVFCIVDIPQILNNEKIYIR